MPGLTAVGGTARVASGAGQHNGHSRIAPDQAATGADQRLFFLSTAMKDASPAAYGGNTDTQANATRKAVYNSTNGLIYGKPHDSDDAYWDTVTSLGMQAEANAGSSPRQATKAAFVSLLHMPFPQLLPQFNKTAANLGLADLSANPTATASR